MTYALLETHHKKLSHLAHVEAMASWDEAVMMPAGSGDARAEALATLRVMAHELATQPVVAQWLQEAQDHAASLTAAQRANLHEMKRAHIRATALTAPLVEACSRAESKSEQAWRVMRAQNNWKDYAPLLTQVVQHKREAAQALSAQLDLDPYDALMDGYEPGARTHEIDRVFEDLEAFLPPFIDRVVEHQKGHSVVKPVGPFSVEAQRALGVEVMRAIGFDFERGRLDVSHHPFCGGVPQDVRITTRYSTDNFVPAFMGVLHETGHAKYEQNLPREWVGQPAGQARSMAIHESQSLFQEMQVGRSPEFLRFVTPHMTRAFPEAAAQQPAAFTPQNIGLLCTRVNRSFIRVDADECTYPCHVILRYRLEKDLMLGTLKVTDLPEAWAAGMQKLLHLDTRGNDKDGCMQDVHWPSGLFGYFPTYTLGAMTAAQLFAAAERALPTVREEIARGEFDSLNAWLAQHIWRQASLWPTHVLLEQATGSVLRADAFKTHLQRRYLAS